MHHARCTMHEHDAQGARDGRRALEHADGCADVETDQNVDRDFSPGVTVSRSTVDRRR